MVLAKSKNAVGLGNSLMNDRFGRGKGADRKKASHVASIERTGPKGETYVTNEPEGAAWVKMRSVTEQGALDEFLSTAELAGTDFTAEKINKVQIIHTDQKNPYLLSAADERSTLKKHQKNKDRLTIPRRPKWNETTTTQELDAMERQSLLDWRRGLAELQENQDLLMTPFERNLEVWRQLWRVIERSDLVIQIADARNPLLFRNEDLDKYVKEVDPQKRTLLLINKADMMTLAQRKAWADYFDSNNIVYSFYSASLAKERSESMLSGSSDSEDEALARVTEKATVDDESPSDGGSAKDGSLLLPKKKDRTAILTVDELEDLFLSAAPEKKTEDNHKRPTTIGLVGYPNVGKSSTINSLLGAKKVSVSATPGKTKHFQTLYLSSSLMLCDCPGLVLPNFATTKAELVVNGILPIDQQREFTGPTGLVAQRIPRPFLEAVYGMKIYLRPLDEGGTGVPTASELLRAYARARGFATTGHGQPDESRAARVVLKDYVNGKLLFCHPPPADPPIDPLAFNQGLYDISHLPERRQKAVLTSASVHTDKDVDKPDIAENERNLSAAAPQQSARGRQFDSRFFGSGGRGNAGHLIMPFNYKYSQQGMAQQYRDQLSGRKQRVMAALENDVDVSEIGASSKKHFKGGKKKAKDKKAMTKEDWEF